MKAFRNRMLRMAHITVIAVILFNAIGQNCLHGVRIIRKEFDVIHKGTPLQDLVESDSRITPHDQEFMNAFVKPKLLEDSKDEGMMLQKNGIEDFRPLDFSMDTDEDVSDSEQDENGFDQMSVTDNSNKNEGGDLRDMPEYNMETKADFKGNQEAIDWMMKDPNDYNVKSYEDSSVLEDTDNFRQSKDPSLRVDDGREHTTHSSFHHHRNHGSKRHHDTSTEDSFSQGFDLYSDTQSLLNENEMTTRNNRHRHEKTTGWKDKNDNDDDDETSENNKKDNDDDDESSKNGNVSNSETSWDEIGDDTANDMEQSHRETTMKNLNSRIKNQDRKLFKELENFRNIDNYGNVDADVLGTIDEQNDELENIRDISESIQNQDEESNSEEEKLSKERTDDKQEDDDESESKHEKEISDHEDKISTANGRKDYQEDDDRGSEQVNENNDDEDQISNDINDDDYQNDNDRGSGDENKSASDQLGSKNGKEDKLNSKSYSNKYNEDGKSSPKDEEDETDGKEGKEITKANAMSSEQKISHIKAKYANREDKLKVMKGKETEHNDNHKPVHENAHSLNNTENSEKSQEKKGTKDDKGTQVVSINEKENTSNRKPIELKETTIQSKGDNERYIPTDSIGHEVETSTVSSLENGKHSDSKDGDSGNSNLLQVTNILSKSENEKHIPTDYLKNDDKITSTSSAITENGKHSSNSDTKLQHSNTHQVSLSVSKYNEKTITAGRPLLTTEKAETHDNNNRQQLIDQKLKDIEIKMKRISETKSRPASIERKKAEHHKVNKYGHDGSKNRPSTTGFRRNQPIYGPSTSIYTLADLQKLQRIVSYLRGTATTRSSPTRTSTVNPDSFSLKNLYYYPIHPTPQDQTAATPGTKDSTFSEWNDWSTCSVTCGKGTSVRARVCLVSSCTQNDLFQTRHCHRDVCSDEVEREALEEHNKLRRKHFSPPLLWSYSLARKAQQIAQSLAAKDFLTLDDLQEPYGESLAQIQYNNEHLAKKAIDRWYSEKNTYSFSYPEINAKTRHFAQIVWKGTREMGLAVARSPSGDYAFVVALYSPPIDSKGHLRQNVLPPGVKNDLYSTFRRSTEQQL